MMEYNFSSFVAIMKYEICGFSAYKLTNFFTFQTNFRICLLIELRGVY